VYFTLQKIILKLNVLLTYLQYTFVVDHNYDWFWTSYARTEPILKIL